MANTTRIDPSWTVRALVACALPAFWGVLSAVPATAVPIEVEEWRAQSGSPGGVQVTVEDDFEDGVFDAAFYPVQCGGTPGESGGALVLDSLAVSSGCGAQPTNAVSGNVTLASPGFLEATIRYAEPDEGDSYGIQLGALGGNFVGLTVSVLGGTLAIAAVEQEAGFLQLLGISVLSTDLTGFSASTVTLRITTDEDGDDLAAAFSFGLDGGALQPVMATRPGRIAGGVSYGPVLFTTGSPAPVPEPGTALLLGCAVLGLGVRGRGRRGGPRP